MEQERGPYEAPKLTEVGSVKDLTLGSASWGFNDSWINHLIGTDLPDGGHCNPWSCGS